MSRIQSAHCGHDDYPPAPPPRVRSKATAHADDEDDEGESDGDRSAQAPLSQAPTSVPAAVRAPPTPSLSPGAPDDLADLLGKQHRALRPIAGVLREAGVDSADALLALKQSDWADLCGEVVSSRVKPFQSVLLARVKSILSA